jgi:hypothetical protein
LPAVDKDFPFELVLAPAQKRLINSTLKQPMLPPDVSVLKQPLHVSVLLFYKTGLPLKVLVRQQTMLPPDVSVLKQPLHVSVLLFYKTGLPLKVLVRQQTMLPLDVFMFYGSLCCTWTCLVYSSLCYP